MNKSMFWTGISIFILELGTILAYLLATSEWFSFELLYQAIIWIVLGMLNLTAFIFIIVGAISK